MMLIEYWKDGLSPKNNYFPNEFITAMSKLLWLQLWNLLKKTILQSIGVMGKRYLQLRRELSVILEILFPLAAVEA